IWINAHGITGIDDGKSKIDYLTVKFFEGPFKGFIQLQGTHFDRTAKHSSGIPVYTEVRRRIDSVFAEYGQSLFYAFNNSGQSPHPFMQKGDSRIDAYPERIKTGGCNTLGNPSDPRVKVGLI